MNERQLQSFLLAAQMGSFSKAADRCYISPSALIGQINLLEKDLGFPLFDRGYHGNTLTPAGKVFYDAAEEILSRYHAAVQEGRRLTASIEPVLTVACPYEQFPDFLTQAYQNCLERFPLRKVSFLHASFDSQFDVVRSGSAQISFTAEPEAQFVKELSFTPLVADTYSFCMSHTHPLSTCRKITPELLKPYHVLCGRYSYLKLPFSEQLARYGIKSEVVEEHYSIEFRLQALSAQDIFVIHSLWNKPYEQMCRVISSAIPAGDVGYISKGVLSAEAASFVELCKEAIHGRHLLSGLSDGQR